MKQVLDFAMEPGELKRMSFKQLCEKVYLYDPASQFKAQAAAEAVVTSWSAQVVPMLQYMPRPLAPDARACVSYFRSRFCDASAAFSIPRAIYEIMQQRDNFRSARFNLASVMALHTLVLNYVSGWLG